MLEFFLALALLADIGQSPPVIKAQFKTMDECARVAMKLNASPQMQTPEAKQHDAMFICLRFVDTSY